MPACFVVLHPQHEPDGKVRDDADERDDARLRPPRNEQVRDAHRGQCQDDREHQRHSPVRPLRGPAREREHGEDGRDACDEQRRRPPRQRERRADTDREQDGVDVVVPQLHEQRRGQEAADHCGDDRLDHSPRGAEAGRTLVVGHRGSGCEHRERDEYEPRGDDEHQHRSPLVGRLRRTERQAGDLRQHRKEGEEERDRHEHGRDDDRGPAVPLHEAIIRRVLASFQTAPSCLAWPGASSISE
jgi:hypothetical protein